MVNEYELNKTYTKFIIAILYTYASGNLIIEEKYIFEYNRNVALRCPMLDIYLS